MSSTTPNLGLTKTTASETIGQNWAASNDSGGNFDIIDTKMGAVGNTSLQAQVNELSSQITKTGYNMNQWMSELEDSDNSGYMWAQGNLRVITFQGKRRTHAEDEILFTIPSEHRPSMIVRCAGSYNGTSVVISLNTDGTCVLFVANGQTATGRIYFSVAYMH